MAFIQIYISNMILAESWLTTLFVHQFSLIFLSLSLFHFRPIAASTYTQNQNEKHTFNSDVIIIQGKQSNSKSTDKINCSFFNTLVYYRFFVVQNTLLLLRTISACLLCLMPTLIVYLFIISIYLICLKLFIDIDNKIIKMIYLFDEIKTYFCFSQKFHFNVMDCFRVKRAFRKSDELDRIRNKNFIVLMIQ